MVNWTLRMTLVQVCLASAAFTPRLPAAGGVANVGAARENAPFLAPVRLHLAFSKALYQPAGSLTFTLRVENASEQPVVLYALWPTLVLMPDVRGMRGNRIDVSSGVSGTPGILEYLFQALRPHASKEVVVRWLDVWNLPSPLPGRYRVRFGYSTEYAAYLAKRLGWHVGAWVGTVLSNTVVLDFGSRRVRVVGDWPQSGGTLKQAYTRSDVKLTEGYEKGSCDPAEICLRLFAIQGNRRQAVHRPWDLRGLVRVKSKTAALRFVRLFTSVDTHYLFPDFGALEARTPDRSEGEVFGTVWMLSPSDARALHPPRVVREGSGFVVERDLVTYPDAATGDSMVYRAVERVGPDGQYSRRIAQVIFLGNMSNKPSVLLPFY